MDQVAEIHGATASVGVSAKVTTQKRLKVSETGPSKESKTKSQSIPAHLVTIDDDLILEVATPVQATVPLVMESAYRASVSTNQALGMVVSEPIALVSPNHDTPPTTMKTHTSIASS